MASYAERNGSQYRNKRQKSRKIHELRCDVCGGAFVAEHRSARFCSMACVGVSKRKVRSSELVVAVQAPRQPRVYAPDEVRSSGGVFVSGPCGWCRESFTALTFNALAAYCSQRCSRAVAKYRHGRFVVAPARRLALYERDGWVCGICGEVVDRGDTARDWAPSLDHIVPRSQGGSDDDANLRTAHMWCNSVRGDLRRWTDLDLRGVA